MSKTNCKNCGAALDICSSKCAFCGTKNINMTDIDLSSGEAANFIFKLPNNFKDAEGKEIFLTMLAIPELQTIEMRSEPTRFIASTMITAIIMAITRLYTGTCVPIAWAKASSKVTAKILL